MFMQLTKLAARLGLAAVLLATFNLQFSTARDQGTAFTYQGVLSQNGVAINGSNDLTFTLYNAVSAGATVGASNVVNDLVMSNGLFTVTLDFGAGAFDGSARWLQIAARPGLSLGAYTNLAPRTPITPTPYAMYAGGAALSGTYGSAVTFNNAANQFSGIGSNLTALNASQLTGGTVPAAALGNAWRITGNSNTTAGTHFLGTTDNRPLEFRVNNQRGLRLENGSNFFATGVNVIGGHSGNVVADGLVGATIAGGGANQLGSQLTNTVAASYATIGGGTLNGASGLFSTVAGGNRNAAAGESSSIGGGEGNQVTGLYGTIPGGKDNVAVLYALAAGYRAGSLKRRYVFGSPTLSGPVKPAVMTSVS